MAMVSHTHNLAEADVASGGRISRKPLRTAAMKEINALANYVNKQIFGGNRRRQSIPRSQNKDIGVIDIADFEDEPDVPIHYSFWKRGQGRKQHQESMRSPRSVLQKMVPNNAVQMMHMDLLLLDECPSMQQLRKCAWKGCSPQNRAQVWRLLLGQEPLRYELRETALELKRQAYREYVNLLCAPQNAADVEISRQIKKSRSMQKSHGEKPNEPRTPGRRYTKNDNHDIVEYSDYAMKTLRQIEMDLPRTHPHTPIFHVPELRNPMRRILYLYAMLNPSKNYVQGMNELLTPILVVFLTSYLKESSGEGVEEFLRRESIGDSISEQDMATAEADVFWTFSLLLSSVDDNFVAGQPGVLKRIASLENIVKIVDPLLQAHLSNNGIQFLQFSYRWMSCLLMRELPFPLVVKLWDALLAEEDGLGDLQVYFCAAILIKYRAQLLSKGFEECIMFLQRLPTNDWKAGDIDLLLSQAHVWKNQLSIQSPFKESCAW